MNVHSTINFVQGLFTFLIYFFVGKSSRESLTGNLGGTHVFFLVLFCFLSDVHYWTRL